MLASYDLQPASLTRVLKPLSAIEEAATVLSGSVLEHLRAGRTFTAAEQVDRLTALIDLV